MSYHQKGIVSTLLLVIILVGLLGVVYFVFNSKTTPNSNSNVQKAPLKQTTVSAINPNTLEEVKTFKNDLGFQFSYQPPYQVMEDKEEDYQKRGNGDFRKNFTDYVGYEVPKVLGIYEVLDDPKKLDSAPVTIWVFENPNNLDSQAYFNKYWYYPFMWGDFTFAGKAKLKPTNESTISGKLAYSQMVDYQDGSPNYIYLPAKDKMFLIRVLKSQSKLTDQVIATFKLN